MKLTIGVLISNRIETVKKCLESVKPLVDKGIAELICVDTITGTQGKVSDGSAELAKKYTDKVYVFPWINDFSAARNVTLEHASGEWYVFCDDDEWFEDVKEIDDFFSSNEYLNYNSASYIIRNYKDKAGTQWADTRAVRFVKRTEELRFEGVVHEAYNKIKLPCREFSCFAHHYGYAFENEEEKKAHTDRNIKLLKEELNRRPKDLRLRTQMALELASFDNEGALKFVEETLKNFSESSNEPYYQWLESLKFPLFEALGKKPEEAEEEFQSIKEKVDLSETALLAINYSLTRLWLLKDVKDKATIHIKEYFRLSGILKENSDMRQKQNTADFEKYLTKDRENEMKEYEEYCMSNNPKFSAENYNIDELLKELNEVSFDDFKVIINNMTEQSESCFEDEKLNSVLAFFEKEQQILYSYVLYKMVETEIKRAVERGASGNSIAELYIECIQTERKMFEMLFKPEVFTPQGLNWVEPEVRYNDILYRFISGGGKDLKLCLEAAKIRPDMANVIKVWLGALA